MTKQLLRQSVVRTTHGPLPLIPQQQTILASGTQRP
jgi:hypothetical protein